MWCRELRSWLWVGSHKNFIRVVGVVYEPEQLLFALVFERGETLDQVKRTQLSSMITTQLP